jgi:P27 family predicted phage terminase small subunit
MSFAAFIRAAFAAQDSVTAIGISEAKSFRQEAQPELQTLYDFSLLSGWEFCARFILNPLSGESRAADFFRGTAMPARAKSANEHWLSGSNRPRAKSPETSVVRAGRPKFSADLSRPARLIFKRLCKLLEQRGALTSGDSELLRLYSFLFDRHQRALAKVLAQGEICTYTRLDSNGAPHEIEKENLHLKVAERAEAKMLSILDRLGLTPIARQKVKPIAAGPEKRQPVPGSVWAENPEWFTDDGVYIPPEQRGQREN